jgi:hypothetical protein
MAATFAKFLKTNSRSCSVKINRRTQDARDSDRKMEGASVILVTGKSLLLIRVAAAADDDDEYAASLQTTDLLQKATISCHRKPARSNTRLATHLNAQQTGH